MAQLVRPAYSEPDWGRAFEADDLIRRRSADSIMAREESPSSVVRGRIYVRVSIPLRLSLKALAYRTDPYMFPLRLPCRPARVSLLTFKMVYSMISIEVAEWHN